MGDFAISKVIVIGAGIGGLTTALALNARGFEVVVYEAAPEIHERGVGINLLPHSVTILGELGLQDELLAQGVATRELVYFNKFGQRIWGEPRGLFAGYPCPQISLHRGRLQMTLLKAAIERIGADNIRTAHKLDSFSQDAEAVTAQFVDLDGKPVATDRADALIAADGIHSTARKAFYPDEPPPIYGGRVLWRATTRSAPFITGATMFMAGFQDQKFVAYPIEQPDADGRQLINWIAELKREAMPNREDWNRPGRIEDFLPEFEGWIFPWLDIPELIRGAQSVYEFPLVDRDPLPQWSFGRVTLLGDAAHPLYPIGSNGASQAILDARALADALSASDDTPAALKAYQDARLPPTAAVVLANRGNGPEQCMQLAEERAPNGFERIEDVIPMAELEAIAARYKQVAGFSKAAVSKR